uniref:Uncharacterized protein n=1 Tax=mine drainage metagenome TaxID=410659 RepID=E6PM14_9ZZZZ
MVDDQVLVFNGESGQSTVATGTRADGVTVFDEALWTRLTVMAQQGESDAAQDHPD